MRFRVKARSAVSIVLL